MKTLLLLLLSIPTISFADATPVVEQTLEQTVVKMLNDGTDALKTVGGSIVDISKAEIPLIVQEYLNWHWVRSLIISSLFMSIFIGSVIFFYKNTYKNLTAPWATKCDYETIMTTEGKMAVMGIIFMASGFFACLPLACSNMDWLQISVAPRVYLIDTFSDIIKK